MPLETHCHARIQRLPDDLINQIAAGEVVERPSSIVKELVENSLDAGCQRLDVILKDGGIDEITVLDDGMGIDESELGLAVERHATSKVQRFSDLSTLQSFGFRGEALASIASVSEMAIASRTPAMTKAACLSLAYGKSLSQISYEASASGTKITVKKLFAKIPARQKFLRSIGTEFAHCAKIVRELALGNPEIAFFLHHQGKQIHAYATGDRASRFQDCFKPDWEPIHFTDSTSEFTADCFLSPPSRISDRGELLIFVNGRSVRHKTIASAIRNAYHRRFGSHHEPSGALFLDIQRDWVDVNVHPQKWEVRLLRQDSIYAWLLGLVSKQLETYTLPSFNQLPLALTTSPGNHALPVRSASESPTGVFSSFQDSPPSSRYRYLGTLQDRYWIIEDRQGLRLLDLHSLVAYLSKTALRQGELTATSRLIGLPLIVRFQQQHWARAPEYLAVFADLGFAMQRFEEAELTVKTVPRIIPESLATPAVEACLAAGSQCRLDEIKETFIETIVGFLWQPAAGLTPDARLKLCYSLWNLDPTQIDTLAERVPDWDAFCYLIPEATINRHFNRGTPQ